MFWSTARRITCSRRVDHVPVRRLFDAGMEAGIRHQWLDGVEPVVRTATTPKSIRLQWPDGTVVVVGFESKECRRASCRSSFSIELPTVNAVYTVHILNAQ
jgi:hypothetical protein